MTARKLASQFPGIALSKGFTEVDFGYGQTRDTFRSVEAMRKTVFDIVNSHADLLDSPDLTTLTDTAIAIGDYLLFQDISDSNLAKRDTLQGLFDILLAQANSFSADQTFSTQILTNNVLRGSISIGDDAATSFVTELGGFVFIHTAGQTSRGSLFYADCGASPAITSIYAGSTVDLTTGVLTGTTGVDTRVTYSAATDAIYMENRSGSTRVFNFTIIGDQL